MPTTIVLFHQNLRLSDNRALVFAAERGPVVPVYILEEGRSFRRKPGGASRWWLRESLKGLGEDLRKLGAELVLRRGDPLTIVRDLVRETKASAVAWNRRYEPHLTGYDKQLQKALEKERIEVKIHDGFLLFDPEAIRTRGGTSFKVFTPFSKACLSASPPPKPIGAPKRLHAVENIASDRLDDWKLVPRTAQWPKGLAAAWKVSERSARKRFHGFIDKGLDDYKNQRDRPDIDGTSRLSPYLHFGQISPHQIWHAVQRATEAGGKSNGSKSDPSAERFLLEILWREFSWSLLHQFPSLPNKPLVGAFEDFPWRNNKKLLTAWQRGMTGYPIVDAGMRQLWQTGWMHNRVRMVAASFLIKHLLIDWRAGEAWFWDTLVDADLANNSASWQWVAGCGADAAPFFRIFNPILQGKKFDPSGEYVKRYVPELASLHAKYIHTPWLCPPDRLKAAGITLGSTYPLPIVDHDAARRLALAEFKTLKNRRDAR